MSENLGLVRDPGIIPDRAGVLGVPGTIWYGKVSGHTAPNLYVEAAHPGANDDNDGTDPNYPKETVQAAVDSAFLETRSTIYVRGHIEESVVTPDYVTGPSYVNIVGLGPSRYGTSWQSDNVALPSLDMRAVGWRVSGFRFYGNTGAAAIELRHTDSGANDIAIRTIIDHCYFDGLTTGLYGIWSHGCYDVWITNCTFSLWHNGAGTATGLYCATTPLAIPYRNHIVDCHFFDSDNHMIYPMNGSFIRRCMFQKTGYAYTATQVLQTSVGGNPGDDNVVWDNRLTGAYTVAGGYTAGAADRWEGNFSENIAHANVADNGWTVGPPV